jgi:hypothetical protein
MKIGEVEADFLPVDKRMDGNTNITKLLVAPRNFANALKNDSQ